MTKTPFSLEHASYVDAEMKKTVLSLIIISAIFSLLAVKFQTTILVKGNYIPPFYPASSVDITFPENDKTYYSSTLTMRYNAQFQNVVNKLVVYNLDGAGNVTIYDDYNDFGDINGSVTLSGLSVGSHHMVLMSESGTSFAGWDVVYFNIAEPFSTTLIVGSVILVAVVATGLGLLVYLKKLHEKSGVER